MCIKPLDQNPYLTTIGLLSEQQEQEVFAFINQVNEAINQNGSATDQLIKLKNQAKDVLIIKNESVVKTIVMKYATKACGLTLEELMSAGNDGLCKAMDRYVHKHAGSFFSAYAKDAIRWSVVDEIRKRFRATRNQDSLDEISNTVDTYENKKVGWTFETKVADAICKRNQTPEDLLIQASTASLIRRSIDKLPPRQKLVVTALLDFYASGLNENTDTTKIFEALGMKKDNYYFHRRNAFDQLKNDLLPLVA